MENKNIDEEYITDGVWFITPSHPKMISALGRAIWNFLYLEELVADILYESGRKTLEQARALIGEGKDNELKKLAVYLKAEMNATDDIVDELKESIKSYTHARRNYRNAISHATPYTDGYDKDGNYLPGLVLTTDGTTKQLATAKCLLSIAWETEGTTRLISSIRLTLLDYFRSRNVTPISQDHPHSPGVLGH